MSGGQQMGGFGEEFQSVDTSRPPPNVGNVQRAFGGEGGYPQRRGDERKKPRGNRGGPEDQEGGTQQFDRKKKQDRDGKKKSRGEREEENPHGPHGRVQEHRQEGRERGGDRRRPMNFGGRQGTFESQDVRNDQFPPEPFQRGKQRGAGGSGGEERGGESFNRYGTHRERGGERGGERPKWNQSERSGGFVEPKFEGQPMAFGGRDDRPAAHPRNEPRTCRICNEEGHVARACPQNVVKEYNPHPNTCNHCHEEGHYVRNCPSKDKPRSLNRDDGNFVPQRGQFPETGGFHGGGRGETRTCNKCGVEGHIARFCPGGPMAAGPTYKDRFETAPVLQQSQIPQIDAYQTPADYYNQFPQPYQSQGSEALGAGIFFRGKSETPPPFQAEFFEPYSRSQRTLSAEQYVNKSNQPLDQPPPTAAFGAGTGFGFPIGWTGSTGKGSHDFQKAGFGGNVGETLQQDERRTCNYCHEEGHYIKECPKKRPPRPDVGRSTGRDFQGAGFGGNVGETPKQDERRTCNYCHEEGHFIKECPKKPPRPDFGRSYGESSRPREQRPPLKCYNCREEGHMSRNCPKKLDNENVLAFQPAQIADTVDQINVPFGSTIVGSNAVNMFSMSDLGTTKDSNNLAHDFAFRTSATTAIGEEWPLLTNNMSEFPALQHCGPMGTRRSKKQLKESGVEPGTSTEAVAGSDDTIIVETDETNESIEVSVGPTESQAETRTILDEKEPRVAVDTLAMENAPEIELPVVESNIKHDVVLVDQLGKKDELMHLILDGQQNYKESAYCQCDFFTRCQCRKSVLVLVNRWMTMECIRVRLGGEEVPVVWVRQDMDQREREINMQRFKYSKHLIMLMLGSEAPNFACDLGNIDWLILLDLPSTIDEYKKHVDSVTREEKPLVVTSFYDPLMDIPVLEDLMKVMKESGQTVPPWMTEQLSGAGDWMIGEPDVLDD